MNKVQKPMNFDNTTTKIAAARPSLESTVEFAADTDLASCWDCMAGGRANQGIQMLALSLSCTHT